MIRRFLYLGIAKSKCFEPVYTPGLLYLSAARYENYILLYAETDKVDFYPEISVKGETYCFPEGQHWIRIPHIFYYNRPDSKEQWSRKLPSKPEFKVAKLKEDCVAPYVFYHYQLQEEDRIRRSKYTLIGLLADFLVYYNESPEICGEPRKGSLETHNTPAENWSEQMKAYFCDEKWLETEPLFRVDVLWKENF